MEYLQQKKMVLATVASLVILACVFVTWGFQSRYNASLAQLPITEELAARFADANPALDIHAQESASLWWDSSDGYSFIIPVTEPALLTAVLKPFADVNIPETFFRKELTVADEVFVRRGFVRNSLNSSTSTLDTHLYDYVQAYEKGKTLCVATVSADYSSYPGSGIGANAKMGYLLTVSCGVELPDIQEEQRAISNALGPRYKGLAVQVDHRDGDFIAAGIRGRRAGMLALLKREGDTYRVLLVTQEAPPCTIIDTEKIPASILSAIGNGACYESSGKYRAPATESIKAVY